MSRTPSPAVTPPGKISLSSIELSALLNAVIDTCERCNRDSRRHRRGAWQSDDGRVRIERETTRPRPAALLHYDRRVTVSRTVLYFDGMRCFESREPLWPDPVGDVGEHARVEIPSRCHETVMAFHRRHDTWVARMRHAGAQDDQPAPGGRGRTASMRRPPPPAPITLRRRVANDHRTSPDPDAPGGPMAA